MELSAQQLEQFDRDGFLVFPDLFSRNEVAVLRREVARLSQAQADEVVREHTGGVRTIFRVHENDGPTRSRPFRALVHTPRLLRPVNGFPYFFDDHVVPEGRPRTRRDADRTVYELTPGAPLELVVSGPTLLHRPLAARALAAAENLAEKARRVALQRLQAAADRTG